MYIFIYLKNKNNKLLVDIQKKKFINNFQRSKFLIKLDSLIIINFRQVYYYHFAFR